MSLNPNEDDNLFITEDQAVKTPLDELYEHGTLCVRNNASQISQENLLYLYSRFKYITEGPCNCDRPSGLFNFEAKKKWDSWKLLGSSISKEECKQEYIKKLDEILPHWKDTCTSLNEADKKGTFGIRCSTMGQNEEVVNYSDCFDVCKSGNIDQLKKLINSENLDKKDENGMSLIMWACDRGLVDMVKFLLKQKADVNLQDADGQTCLHYAVSCEHAEIVKILLKESKIDVTIQDSDGLSAKDLATNKDILVIFNQ
ncbi:acyl- -binding domain-containing 6 [Brachionus plicatilis]|uniref:Acyl-CoA-binding domain-containing protein 6 n=1 Tax=Brachionus plicatilis TaxID=10195 RepID=A0A3M7S660_BRAPC|nr:acyl- -binding domain-containing 6 [Brachionus plicatilis]